MLDAGWQVCYRHGMDINQVVKDYFGGSNAKAARALGVTRAAVHQWRKDGLPPLRKYQIESIIKAQPSTAETPPTG